MSECGGRGVHMSFLAERGGQRRGFTLIELLMVVLVIGLLMGLISSALLKARQNAQRKQRDVECLTLKTAILNYRHEYGRWPIKKDDPGPTVTYATRNYELLQRMVSKSHDYNEREIRFINLGEYFTYWQGQRYPMHVVWQPDRTDNTFPVVDPWNKAYKFDIDLNLDVVTVTNVP